MADLIRTTTEVFRNTYEVKNGQIGSQDVLNFAVDKLKLEFNDLWNWCAGDDTTVLDSTGLATFIIDDRLYSDLINDNVNTSAKVRSTQWVQSNIFDTLATDTNSTIRSWNCANITFNIKNNTVSGGTWN